jgi:hypothetical protein
MSLFHLPRDLPGLANKLPAFVQLAGEDAWWKRVNQLERDARRSEFQTKIVLDHHWLEMEIAAQIAFLRDHGRLLPEQILPNSMAALRFAATVAELHERLGARGRVRLQGRLRGALKSTFSGFYLELDLAIELLQQGFDVTFPDLEADAPWDLSFARNGIAGELECKSLSADAGRKIHRKDFYRFVDSLRDLLLKRIERGSREIIVITLDDRLVPDVGTQGPLRSSTARMLSDDTLTTLTENGFRIEREPLEKVVPAKLTGGIDDLNPRWQKAYGGNCHVAGPLTHAYGCVVAVRSVREDDPSRAQLDALKKAASQLSGRAPGFIAVQHEEVTPQDLAQRPLRRKAGILAMALFHSDSGQHIAAIHHSTFSGFHSAHGIIARPAFVFWNPRWSGSPEGLPFSQGLSNSDFAQLLGLDPSKAEPDDDGGGVRYW